jgi:hypothetical protein
MLRPDLLTQFAINSVNVASVGATGFRATQEIADQGAACTNAELSLSRRWAASGSATVPETFEWTITAGTTTSANPIVTDTLTNALPTASTVCEMIITGGTRTAVASDSFDQTTLSATAPVFTFRVRRLRPEIFTKY